MRSTPLNLPKWLLLLVVFGVFLGQAHQIVCKAGAHASETTLAAAETLSSDDHASDDGDGTADGGCAFHCQFNGSAILLITTSTLPVRLHMTVSRIEFQQDEATSRSGSIDLPPQIA
ncbi:MAG: hypothetical protein JSR82_05930 [Verrucomicrobia bacterium]|nr:hypothetical protein [Verrucomicrobiota bacterium]